MVTRTKATASNLRAQQAALRNRRRSGGVAALQIQTEAARRGVSPERLTFDRQVKAVDQSPQVRSIESKINSEKQTLDKITNEINKARAESARLRELMVREIESSGTPLTQNSKAQNYFVRAKALDKKALELNKFLPQLQQNVQSLQQSREGIRNLVFQGQNKQAQDFINQINTTSANELLKFGDKVQRATLKQEDREFKRNEALREFSRVTGRNAFIGSEFSGIDRNEFQRLSLPTRKVLFGVSDVKKAFGNGGGSVSRATAAEIASQSSFPGGIRNQSTANVFGSQTFGGVNPNFNLMDSTPMFNGEKGKEKDLKNFSKGLQDIFGIGFFGQFSEKKK